MANEEYIQQLRDDIEAIKENAGVVELAEAYKQVGELRDNFHDVGNEIVAAVRNEIYKAYGNEKQTLNSEWTLKNGSVYNYGSSDKASRADLYHNMEDFEEVDEERRETFKEALEVVKNDLDDVIDTKCRTLMDDDRDFDAAKINATGYGKGLKLIDLKDSRSCSGNNVDLNVDLRQREVKEIIKTIEYQPELLEVTQEMKERISSAVENRQEWRDKVRY